MSPTSHLSLLQSMIAPTQQQRQALQEPEKSMKRSVPQEAPLTHRRFPQPQKVELQAAAPAAAREVAWSLMDPLRVEALQFSCPLPLDLRPEQVASLRVSLGLSRCPECWHLLRKWPGSATSSLSSLPAQRHHPAAVQRQPLTSASGLRVRL